jgi:hypothetical protein
MVPGCHRDSPYTASIVAAMPTPTGRAMRLRATATHANRGAPNTPANSNAPASRPARSDDGRVSAAADTTSRTPAATVTTARQTPRPARTSPPTVAVGVSG